MEERLVQAAPHDLHPLAQVPNSGSIQTGNIASEDGSGTSASVDTGAGRPVLVRTTPCPLATRTPPPMTAQSLRKVPAGP